MNLLVMNQSVVDTWASCFTLLSAVVEVDGTRMSRYSIYDQFVCRAWLTRLPFWVFLITSTYNILLMALERYVAVIYPVWYSCHVRSAFVRWLNNVLKLNCSSREYNSLFDVIIIITVIINIVVVVIIVYRRFCKSCRNLTKFINLSDPGIL